MLFRHGTCLFVVSIIPHEIWECNKFDISVSPSTSVLLFLTDCVASYIYQILTLPCKRICSQSR